jgi:hypothetical protein
MRAEQAVSQVNNTIFMPGWMFRAEPFGSSLIWVGLMVSTMDTSHPTPEGRYETPVTIMPDTLFSVAGMDEAALSARLLELAFNVIEHESREFFRVRQEDGSWKAPFHPHNAEGNAAWDAREKTTR